MIELKNIDVTFQNGSHEFKAVDNVSLKINKGEIFGIVGWIDKEYDTGDILVLIEQFPIIGVNNLDPVEISFTGVV